MMGSSALLESFLTDTLFQNFTPISKAFHDVRRELITYVGKTGKYFLDIAWEDFWPIS